MEGAKMSKKIMAKEDRYSQLIEKIFFAHYQKGIELFEFAREEIEHHARNLRIQLPKNLGDIIYSFRYRRALPKRILETESSGRQWVIFPAGRSKYRFELTQVVEIFPNRNLIQIKIPDATPGIIASYALNDEQALLAKVRYNRLIDIFTRVTCYSLQNHLRTTVAGMGQVETDEIYIGLDRNGVHYVLPIQAKGGKDQLNIVQIQQDIQMSRDKFPGLICRAIAAQFISDDLIALFEFAETQHGIRIANEKHYRLVSHVEISEEDLKTYRQLQTDEQ
jgi:hypothetical protein